MTWFAAVALIVHMHLFFLAALRLKNNGVADIAWGLGFVVVGWALIFSAGQPSNRLWLLVGLVTIWGVRLAGHILLRNRKKKEDWRYAQWRKQWGRWWLVRSYLQVFVLQGCLLAVVATPMFLVAGGSSVPLVIWDVVAVGVWLIGFLFEAVGDYQLTVFKSNPANKGKLLTTGLWRYTRHPNYFGEVALWWGVFLLVLPVPYGWLAIVSPALITYLLLKVSGIPMLEKKYQGRADFEAYKKRTNAFFPWFPGE